MGRRPGSLGESRVGAVIFLTFRLPLWGIAWLYWIQPRFMQMMWGNLLGTLLRLAGFRAKVVQDNLTRAASYHSQLALHRDTIARKSYDHLGNLVFEILLHFGTPSLLRRFVFKYMTIVHQDYIDGAKAKGKGVIFLASHLGNWELMAAAGGAMLAADLMMVTKHLKPEWLHQAVQNGRMACDVQATYEPRTLKDVLRHLKKNGAVGIVLDQYVGPPVGIRVPFFGTPVGTSMLVATLAKRTGAVVLPVFNYRKPDGHWVLEIAPAIEWETHDDPHYELALNTSRYSQVIEQSILKRPEQWLWTHRRFKGNLDPLLPDEWSQARARH